MSNVLLTATNPEDSSVVPVACNEKGELKLEEPPVFDGAVDGDLTVTGKIAIGTTPSEAKLDAGGDIRSFGYNTLYDDRDNSATRTRNFQWEFENVVGAAIQGKRQIGGSAANTTLSFRVGGNAVANECLQIKPNKSVVVPSGKIGIGLSNPKAQLDVLGNATFADGKAGFTAEGYLWCTTRRGDTVILDATSNGLATWADYTPPNVRTIIKDKVESWSENEEIDPDFVISPEDQGETGQIRI